MDDPIEIRIWKKDGEILLCKPMYLIVWEGKAFSGGELLVRGDDIASIDVIPKE
jgi:hypothetical protein